jgi:hypothetical protein
VQPGEVVVRSVPEVLSAVLEVGWGHLHVEVRDGDGFARGSVQDLTPGRKRERAFLQKTRLAPLGTRIERVRTALRDDRLHEPRSVRVIGAPELGPIDAPLTQTVARQLREMDVEGSYRGARGRVRHR